MAFERCKSLMVALALCLPALSANAGSLPRFEDYKVEHIFQGPNHPLEAVEKSDDKWASYRSKAVQRKVNFAGHYIVYTGNCGAGAICGEILDAQTGKIVDGFPNAYELDSADGSAYDAGFRPDSRLLSISGIAADPEKDQTGKTLAPENRTRYFEMKNDKLVLIHIE